jgi:hypothetical protein
MSNFHPGSLSGFFSRRISAMKRLIQAWKIPVSSTRRDQLRPNVSKRQKSAASRVAGMDRCCGNHAIRKRSCGTGHCRLNKLAA